MQGSALLNQRQRGELAVEPWRKIGQAASVFFAGWRVGFVEVTPPLVSPLRSWRDNHQLGRADDIDSAVATVFEPKDLLPGDHPVLDDPVKRTADKFFHPLGPHPRRHAHDSVGRHPARNAVLERLEACAANGDLGQMKRRHSAPMAWLPSLFND